MTKILVLFLFSTFFAFSQSKRLDLTVIPDGLRENSNSIILKKSVDIQLTSNRKMVIKTDKIITVFNENGLAACDAVEYYSKSTKIKNLTIALYDKAGDLVKVFKQKDLKDYSISQGYEVSDGRLVFWDFKTSNFPITIHYQSEVESITTAFISPWTPIENFSQAVVESEYSIMADASLGLQVLESNFEGYTIEKKESSPSGFHYRVTNLPAILEESYAPHRDEYLPKVVCGVEKFNLENYQGTAQNWEQFSAWNYNNLIAGTDELSAETQEKIKNLVKDVDEPLEKAKLIYKYMQSKTRYISIQLGIGGWKPMLARDVDRLGYGDCKALTNYTRALFKIVGIESYYAVVYGGETNRDIRSDLIAMQGNHVILALPIGEEMFWLECTSQKNPFGYIADFTDNRQVLLIAPEKGRLMRTKKYELSENTQFKNATIDLDAAGGIAMNLTIESKGSQFKKRSQLLQKSKTDLDKYYKEYFSNINSLTIDNIAINADLEQVVCSESMSLLAPNYARILGNEMIFIPNAINVSNSMLSRNRNRKAPFKISREYFDTDVVTIRLPENFELEILPTHVHLVSEYGEYQTKYEKLSDHTIKYTRTIAFTSGDYPKEKYEDFRLFRMAIAKNDQAKIVLKKK